MCNLDVLYLKKLYSEIPEKCVPKFSTIKETTLLDRSLLEDDFVLVSVINVFVGQHDGVQDHCLAGDDHVRG